MGQGESEDSGEEDVELLPHYLISGAAYSCMDAFDNGNFNMIFVQKKSEEEIKLIEDMQINFEKI